MSRTCNIRYQQLRLLEAEFTALDTSEDLHRRKQLAEQIVALRFEFGSTNADCERLLAKAAAHE